MSAGNGNNIESVKRVTIFWIEPLEDNRNQYFFKLDLKRKTLKKRKGSRRSPLFTIIVLRDALVEMPGLS